MTQNWIYYFLGYSELQHYKSKHSRIIPNTNSINRRYSCCCMNAPLLGNSWTFSSSESTLSGWAVSARIVCLCVCVSTKHHWVCVCVGAQTSMISIKRFSHLLARSVNLWLRGNSASQKCLSLSTKTVMHAPHDNRTLKWHQNLGG